MSNKNAKTGLLTKDFGLSVKSLTEAGTFEGYGSINDNVDSYGDRVNKGAFEKSLEQHKAAGSTVLMLWQHDPYTPIGVWEDLKEDDKGLYGKGRLILEVQKAQETLALMRNKAIGGLSIGYREVKTKQNGNVLDLLELDLREISPVTFPANREARIEHVKASELKDFASRLREGDVPSVKEFEGILRDAGVPKSMATSIASVGYAKAVRGEPEAENNEKLVRFLEEINKQF